MQASSTWPRAHLAVSDLDARQDDRGRPHGEGDRQTCLASHADCLDRSRVGNGVKIQN
jgi:hypothetical protein